MLKIGRPQMPPSVGGAPQLLQLMQQQSPGQQLMDTPSVQGGQGGDAEPDPNDPNEAQEGQESPGSIDPSIAGYMGPEYGPFQCANCVHFLQPNACQVVAGEIDPNGCCNIFTPGSDQGDQGQDPNQGPPQAPPDQGGQQ